MLDWVVKHSRCSAAVWFGAVGLFVSQTIFITVYHKTIAEIDLVLNSLLVVASTISGALLGEDIIRGSANQGASFGVKRGTIVMLASLLLYCLFVSSWAAIFNKSVGYGLGIFFEFTVVGFVVFGWSVAF